MTVCRGGVGIGGGQPSSTQAKVLTTRASEGVETTQEDVMDCEKIYSRLSHNVYAHNVYFSYCIGFRWLPSWYAEK